MTQDCARGYGLFQAFVGSSRQRAEELMDELLAAPADDRCGGPTMPASCRLVALMVFTGCACQAARTVVPLTTSDEYALLFQHSAKGERRTSWMIYDYSWRHSSTLQCRQPLPSQSVVCRLTPTAFSPTLKPSIDGANTLRRRKDATRPRRPLERSASSFEGRRWAARGPAANVKRN